MSARRLDAELVSRGLARSRTQAREIIVAGVVTVDGRPVVKPATPVDDGCPIVLTRDPDHWVGRAAWKLLGALDRWPVIVENRRCLDVGASTGGFTQVLLERGAAHVTALDVGHDQLVDSLARHPRVSNLPGTNIRSASPSSLGGPFDLVVCDVSFISLTLALDPIRALVTDDGDLVVLVKPQFEVGRDRLGRRGVVTSAHEHRRVLRAVVAHALGLGLHVHGAMVSAITGGDGNREFLLWLASRPADQRGSIDDMLEHMDVEPAP